MLPLELDALHCLLWLLAGDDNTVRVDQQKFAAALHVSRTSMNRALQALIALGALERLSRSGNGTHQLYLVDDPAHYPGCC